MRQKRAKYDYLIVGAGLFGSTFAHLASQEGKKCLVIDKRNHVGGNCYSRRQFGIDVHLYGPHIFHTTNPETWNFVNSLSPMKPFYNQPLAFYCNELYNLPFNMNTFRQIFGVEEPEIVEKYIEADIVPNNNPANLEEYALSVVGRTIYEKLVKGYTEKQWGRKCTELPASLIQRLPLRMTYDNTYFSDQYQGVPEKGYDHLFEQLLNNCDVALGYDYFDNMELFDSLCNRILYTGRLDLLCDGVPALEFRCLDFEHKVLPESNHQGCAVMNYTDSCLPYTRITEHRHFNPSNESKCTIITYEIPVGYIDGSSNECYPVPTEVNLTLQESYVDEASAISNMIFGGRLADYRYYNMDTTIEKAMQLWEREQTLQLSL